MTDLNLSLILRLADRASQPLRRIGGALGGFGRRTEELNQRMARLRQQQAAIDAFRALKQRLEATAQAMREAQARAQGMGQQLGQARRRAQTLRRGLSQAEAEVERLGQQMREAEHPTDEMRAAFQAAERRAESLRRELGQTEDQVERLENGLETARAAARRAAEGHRTLQERTERARRELAEAGLDARRLAEAQARLRRETREAADELARQARRAAETQRRMEALARAQQRLANASMAGAAVGGAGLGVQYAGRRALGLAAPWMDFDAMLDTAMSKMPGATDADREALKALAMDLGDRTAFSATEAMAGVDFFAMSGFDPDKIIATLPHALTMSGAGDVGLGIGADIMTNIMSGLGMAPDQGGRLADVLTATFTGSNVTLPMLGETMKYAAPGARDLGVPPEVLAAAAGVLGDAGIQGSMAGTSLDATMKRLAAPTGEAAKVLARLGVQTKDAEGNMLGFEVILQRLRDAMEGMGSADRSEVINTLVGQEAAKGLSVLLSSLDSLEQKIRRNADAAGLSQRIADQMTDNLKGDVTEMFSALEGLVLREGGAMDTTLRQIAQSVTGVVRAVSSWADENPKLTATLGTVAAYAAAGAVGVGGLMTAVGAVIVPMAILRFSASALGIRLLGLGAAMRVAGRGGRLLAGGLRAAAGGLRAMAAALLATPIGWIIAAVAAVAGLAYAIYANWSNIGAFFKEKWERVKAAFEDGLLNGIMVLLQAFRPDVLLAQTINGLIQWLFGIDLAEVGRQWMDAIGKGFAEGWKSLTDWLDRKIRDLTAMLPAFVREGLGLGENEDEGEDEAPPAEPRPARDRRGRLIQAGAAAATAAALAGAPAAADTGAGLAETSHAMAALAAAGRAMEGAAPPPTDLPLIPATPAGGPAPAAWGAPPEASPQAGPVTNHVDASTTVTVNVPPGSDIHAIVAAVTRELERRQRGALHDLQ